MIKKVTLLLGCLLALLSCDTFLGEEPIAVTIAFNGTQGTLVPESFMAASEVWVFPVEFAAAPTLTTDVSTGHVSGATVISITASSNQALHITGARIEQVYYRPVGASSEIGFIHPTTFEPICPFFLELSGGPAISVSEDGTSAVFDLDLASVAAPWQSMDYDGDGTAFLNDQNEVIEISSSLFFEGYFDNGEDFSGNFPAPLKLYFRIQHRS